MSYYSSDIYKFNNLNNTNFSANSQDSLNDKFFINKDVDDYFNNIINSKNKDKDKNFKILNNSSMFDNFYDNYIYR